MLDLFIFYSGHDLGQKAVRLCVFIYYNLNI